MKSWWVTFTDGTQVCCDGESAYDAKRIAEHFTKKKVAGGEDKDFDVKELPYPSSKAAWRYEHPIHGLLHAQQVRRELLVSPPASVLRMTACNCGHEHGANDPHGACTSGKSCAASAMPAHPACVAATLREVAKTTDRYIKAMASRNVRMDILDTPPGLASELSSRAAAIEKEGKL